ncbi:MAG: hypothetical protein GC164_09830 [Phycisphaera sp.]|nr:hypothetical protein [Phycisphaera sp.]
MDSKHKEELQQNDLEHFLTHFGEFWNKHGNKVLGVVLVVLLALFGIRYMKLRALERQERDWSELATSTSPESFERIAQDTSDPAVRAYANLKAGDLLLEQTLPETKNDRDKTTDKRTNEELLNDARTRYQAAMQAPESSIVLRLNALMGIAVVDEAQNKLDSARANLEKLKAQAKDYPLIAQQADKRLAMLDRLEQPITFAPDKPDLSTLPAPKTGDVPDNKAGGVLPFDIPTDNTGTQPATPQLPTSEPPATTVPDKTDEQPAPTPSP